MNVANVKPRLGWIMESLKLGHEVALKARKFPRAVR